MLLNRERLQTHMAGLTLDAVVATAPENVTYTSGFWALPQWIRRGPQAYVVWPASSDQAPATLITSTATLDLVADQELWTTRTRRYGAFEVNQHPDAAIDPVSARQLQLHNLPGHGDALDALVAELKEIGLTQARIGIDEIGLMPGLLEELRTRLPEVRWVPAASLFRSVRAVKTEAEIARLRRVAEITEASIEAALAIAREGVSELELARAFHTRTVQDDGVPVLGCIGFGERSALMNVQPSQRALHHGEVIRFDVGGRYRHYRADIARIASLGEPAAEIRRHHGALVAGVERACAIIRPGLRCADLFEKVVATVQREGIAHYRRSHVGHGIGLDGYDAPSLSSGSAEVIEEGMVLCVETPYYELGRWGLQVEDMLVVRSHGVERLTASDGDIMVVAS
jgi:Xaa-Pro aminopeptidase